MRRSLTVAATAALLLGVAGTALANDTLPGADTALVEVVVPNQADVDKVVATYDAAEYKRVEDDGSIMLNVEADASELASLRAAGYKIGRTIEDAKHRSQVNAEREATAAREALAADLAKNGVPRGGIKLEGKSVVPTPGEVVIQRANKFTNYNGTFIYVEAHSKATVRITPGGNQFTNPTMAMSVAGPDGVYGTATNMARFIDADPTPDEYLYHRLLVRLPAAQAALPASQTDGARGRGLWRHRHLQGHRVARHDAAAERRRLPEGLLQPLPGPDREPRQARRADRRVREPDDQGRPAAPHERLPAQVAGDHVRRECPRRCSGSAARSPGDQRHG